MHAPPSRCWILLLLLLPACLVLLAGCAVPAYNPFEIVPDHDIVFTRTVTNGTDIFVKLQGGAPVNLSNAGAEWNEEPAYSPNGLQIAFVRRPGGGVLGKRQIYIMDRDGSDVTRLTNDAFNNTHPAWSPGGDQLAFVSDRAGVQNIYRMDVHGANQTRVTANDRNDTSPSWSPDGTQIVFSSELGSSLASPVPRLYRIHSDGTGQTLLSGTADDHEIEPCWSSTDSIVYTRSNETEGAQIYTMTPTGGQVTRLTGGTSATGGWHPTWNNNATQIAFVSDRSGTLRIYTLVMQSHVVAPWLIDAGPEFQPDWGVR